MSDFTLDDGRYYRLVCVLCCNRRLCYLLVDNENGTRNAVCRRCKDIVISGGIFGSVTK